MNHLGELIQPSPSRAEGYLLPFHMDSAKVNALSGWGLGHGWPDYHMMWNNGAYDQWVPAKTELSMGYYTDDELPWHYMAAQAWTVADHYHCSVMAATHPNRLVNWSGYVQQQHAYVNDDPHIGRGHRVQHAVPHRTPGHDHRRFVGPAHPPRRATREHDGRKTRHGPPPGHEPPATLRRSRRPRRAQRQIATHRGHRNSPPTAVRPRSTDGSTHGAPPPTARSPRRLDTPAKVTAAHGGPDRCADGPAQGQPPPAAHGGTSHGHRG